MARRNHSDGIGNTASRQKRKYVSGASRVHNDCSECHSGKILFHLRNDQPKQIFRSTDTIEELSVTQMAHTTHYSSTLFTFEIKIYNANAKQHNTTTTRQSCIVFGRATSVSTRPNLGLEPEIAQASKVHDHDHEVEVRSHGNESQRSNNFLKLGVPRPVTCDR